MCDAAKLDQPGQMCLSVTAEERHCAMSLFIQRNQCRAVKAEVASAVLLPLGGRPLSDGIRAGTNRTARHTCCSCCEMS